MRKVSLGVTAGGTIEARLRWCEDSLRQVERASFGSPFGELLGTAPDVEAAALLLTSWRVLAASGAAASHTGNTTETTLATIEIPAGAMGANGILRVTTLWTTTNSANNKTQRVKLDGTAFLAFVATTQLSHRHVTIIQNRNSASSQVGATAAVANAFDASASAVTTGAIDTTLAKNLTITGQLANAGESITLESYIVELVKKA